MRNTNFNVMQNMRAGLTLSFINIVLTRKFKIRSDVRGMATRTKKADIIL